MLKWTWKVSNTILLNLLFNQNNVRLFNITAVLLQSARAQQLSADPTARYTFRNIGPNVELFHLEFSDSML